MNGLAAGGFACFFANAEGRLDHRFALRRNVARGRVFRVFAASLLMAGLAGCAAPPAAPVTQVLAPVPESGGVAHIRPVLAVAQLAALKDISDAGLMARLGPPDFTRHEPPAEIWQYRNASCVLDLYLYREGGDLKVVHAATRDRANLSQPLNMCSPFAAEQSASN